MTVPYLDASVLVRMLSGDPPVWAESSRSLLERVERGEIRLRLSGIALAEVVYVLTSRTLYGLARRSVAGSLLTIISLPGIEMQSKRAAMDALHIYATTSIDFSDCYTVARMRAENSTHLYSYDRDFDRFQDIERIEP